jgi:hypothetical protein
MLVRAGMTPPTQVIAWSGLNVANGSKAEVTSRPEVDTWVRRNGQISNHWILSMTRVNSISFVRGDFWISRLKGLVARP